MDEQEKIEKRARLRLFLTEIFMSLSVIFLVAFLTMLVLGYSFHLTKLGKDEPVVERTGLVQVSSSPTGATVTLDGGTPLLLRTNTSRTLSAGTHEISLTKDGYDSWTKTVTITEGMMYRLNYPKLFLLDREVEPVLEKLAPSSFVSATPNGEKLLLRDSETKTFSSLDISSSKTAKKSLDFPAALALETVSSVKPLAWSGNSKKLLLRLDGKFAVFDLETPSSSLLLDSLLPEALASGNLADVKFETGSGERLLLLSNSGELFELDLKTQTLSSPLLTHVLKFTNNEDKLLFLSDRSASLALYTYRVGDDESYLLKSLPSNASLDSVRFAWTDYFESLFFALALDSDLKIYSLKTWPEEDIAALDSVETFETVAETSLPFAPASLKARGKGLFFALENSDGTEKAVFDLEAEVLQSFTIQHENSWLDEFLHFEITDAQELWVTDYDGNNWRLLASDVVASSPVVFSKNNKYLYYFTSAGLVREKVS